MWIGREVLGERPRAKLNAKKTAKKNRHGRLRRRAIDMETTHSQGSTRRRAGEKNSKIKKAFVSNLQNESAMTVAAIQKKDETRT